SAHSELVSSGSGRRPAAAAVRQISVTVGEAVCNSIESVPNLGRQNLVNFLLLCFGGKLRRYPIRDVQHSVPNDSRLVKVRYLHLITFEQSPGALLKVETSQLGTVNHFGYPSLRKAGGLWSRMIEYAPRRSVVYCVARFDRYRVIVQNSIGCCHVHLVVAHHQDTFLTQLANVLAARPAVPRIVRLAHDSPCFIHGSPPPFVNQLVNL